MSQVQVFLGCCLTFLLCFMIVTASAQESSPTECPPNISPCKCVTYHFYIICDGSDFTDGQDLKSVLSQPFPGNPEISLMLRNISFPLPPNLLGDKNQLYYLEFYCSSWSQIVGSIDALTFSGVNVTGVYFSDCNLTQTNFEFLGMFSQVGLLHIEGCNVGRFLDFPYTPTLTAIAVVFSSLEEWYPRVNTPNLTSVSLILSNRKNVLHILDALVFYTNLEYLAIPSNELEDVPEQVNQFPRLRALSLSNNPLSILRNGSLHLSSTQLEAVSIYQCGITEIEADAFRGNFSNGFIELSANGLITVDQEVFLPLLNQMYQANSSNSFIFLGSNSFVCGCDMKWLIDENRHLLPKLLGTCSNGTRFDQLDPDGYQYCSDCYYEEGIRREISAYKMALMDRYLLKEARISPNKDSRLLHSEYFPYYRLREPLADDSLQENL